MSNGGGASGEWFLTSVYGNAYRFVVVSPDEVMPGPSWWDNLPDPIFELVTTSFGEAEAREDGSARVLLEIHDRLTGRDLARRLRTPSRDPDRLLAYPFRANLLQILQAAVERGWLRVERVAEPWPFPDVEADEPEMRAPQPIVEEQTTYIAIELRDQAGQPVPNRRYRISLANGRILREGRLDSVGMARADGLAPSMCVVTFPDVDQGTARPAASNALSSPNSQQASVGESTAWVCIQLTGEPSRYTGKRYEITVPDGTVRRGVLDASGLVRIDGIPPGLCVLRLAEHDKREVAQVTQESSNDA